MAKEQISIEEKKARIRKPESEEPAKRHANGSGAEVAGLASLQQLVGNRAVQRLLAQRSGQGSFELDDETAGRINRERGGGQPLDTALQKQASEAMGRDLSRVRVHTSPEAHDLSRQLGAKAFTTGQDVFFREGAYDPHSSGGQELVAHELTHVVQQSSGAVGGAGKMTVNPPGDVSSTRRMPSPKRSQARGPHPRCSARCRKRKKKSKRKPSSAKSRKKRKRSRRSLRKKRKNRSKCKKWKRKKNCQSSGVLSPILSLSKGSSRFTSYASRFTFRVPTFIGEFEP